MANILPMDKQIVVSSALTEGSGIRRIERMTGTAPLLAARAASVQEYRNAEEG